MAARISLVSIIAFFAFLSGCHGTNLDDGMVRTIADSKKIHLDAEQVSVSLGQVNCGVDNELWSQPELVAQRSVARLLDKGRELGFSDDVTLDELGYTQPYAQVRGDFSLAILDGSIDVKETSDEAVKRVQNHYAIKIPHDCFQSPLPLMGVKRGHYAEGVPITIEFAMEEDGWHMQLVR